MPLEPIIDAGEQFAVVRDLRDRVAGGDLLPVLDQLDEARARDEQEFVDLTGAVAAGVGLDEPVSWYLSEHPDDRRVVALKAAIGIAAAWRVRTRDDAQNISPDRLLEFWAILRAVERDLIWLCATEPADPQPWYLRLMTAGGLELGQGEVKRRYGRLAEHHPQHSSAQREFLQQLCPKWGGTWDDVFSFARACVSAAPAGNMSLALIASAHLELWLFEPQHLGRPGVLEEVDAAAERLLSGSATSRFGWVAAHSDFAVLYALAGRPDRAAPHFRILGSNMAERPWGYSVGMRQQVAGIRSSALEGHR